VRRTLETIFKQPLLLLLLMLPIVGVAVAYFMTPRVYQTTATVWALHRVEIIGATGPETNLEATPADTQSAYLIELLQSQEFSLAVAKQSNVASTLNLSPSTLADPQHLDQALFAEISKHVLVVSGGYNLFTISYTNRVPHIAQQVVAAVIQEYSIQSQSFSVTEAQQLLDNYNIQLANAEKAYNTAVAAESKYKQQNPGLTPAELAFDPQFQQLDTQVQQTKAVLLSTQTDIATVNQEMAAQGTNSESLFRVLDPPVANNTPNSRTRDYLVGGGFGLGLALVACILYIIIQIRRDRAVYTARELQEVSTFPVIMQLPALAAEAVPLLVKYDLH
jgi:uncharacterized protein involved in exopolysaccharide biosynthesis